MKAIYFILILTLLGCNSKSTKKPFERTFKEYSAPYSLKEVQLLFDATVSVATLEKEKQDSSFYIYPCFFNQLTLNEIKSVFDTTNYHLISNEYFDMYNDFNFLIGCIVEDFIWPYRKARVELPIKDEKPVILISSPMFIKKRGIAIMYFGRYTYKVKNNDYIIGGSFLVFKKHSKGWALDRMIPYIKNDIQIEIKTPKS